MDVWIRVVLYFGVRPPYVCGRRATPAADVTFWGRVIFIFTAQTAIAIYVRRDKKQQVVFFTAFAFKLINS